MSTFPPCYAVVISDGLSIRTLHPAALGQHRPAVEAILADVLGPEPTASALTPTPKQKHPAPVSTATMTRREIATASGYTGDACQNCGGFAMRRTGVCLTCSACGSTSGGCS